MYALKPFIVMLVVFSGNLFGQVIQQDYCLGGIYEDSAIPPVEMPDGSMYFFHSTNNSEPYSYGKLDRITKLEDNLPVWTRTFTPVDSTWNEAYIGIIESNGNHFTLLTNGRDKGRLCYRNLEDSILWLSDSVYGLFAIRSLEKNSSGYIVSYGSTRYALVFLIDDLGQIKWQRNINYIDDFGVPSGLFTFGTYNSEMAVNPDGNIYLNEHLYVYDMNPFYRNIAIKSLLDSAGQIILADTSENRIWLPSNIITRAYSYTSDLFSRINTRYYTEFYLPGLYQEDTLLVQVTDTRTLNMTITDTVTGILLSMPIQYQQTLSDSTLYLIGLRVNDSTYAEPDQYDTHVFNPGVRAYDNQGQIAWEISLPIRVATPPFSNLMLTYHALDAHTYYLEFNNYDNQHYLHALVRDGELQWYSSLADTLIVNGLPYRRLMTGFSFFNSYNDHDSRSNITPTHIYKLFPYQYFNPVIDTLDERYYYQRIDRQTGFIEKLGILDPEQYPAYYYNPEGPLIINNLIFHKRLNDSAFLLINNCNYCCSNGERDLHIVTASFPATTTATPNHEANQRTVLIYPNPNSGIFTLAGDLMRSGEIHLELVNLAGLMLLNKTISLSAAGYYKVDASGLPRGFYILNIVQAGNMQSFPVVIQ